MIEGRSGPSDFVDDDLGLGGPDEGFGALVVVLDVVSDGVEEFGQAAEDATSLLPADEAGPLIEEGERVVAYWAGHEYWHALLGPLVQAHLSIPEPGLARAERHLDALMRWPATPDPAAPLSRAAAIVEWAFARGDGAEAQLWEERFLATARAMRYQEGVAEGLRQLERCERLRKPPRGVRVR